MRRIRAIDISQLPKQDAIPDGSTFLGVYLKPGVGQAFLFVEENTSGQMRTHRFDRIAGGTPIDDPELVYRGSYWSGSGPPAKDFHVYSKVV